MHHCDNCAQEFEGKPIHAEVNEAWSGPKGRSGVSMTPRIFCSDKCEQEHRKAWEVKDERTGANPGVL